MTQSRTESIFARLFAPRKSGARSNAPRTRKMGLERLEDRALLSVSAAEYASIRDSYAEFNLPASESDVNIIEIAASKLSVAALKSALDEAGGTTADDLIVVRTTSKSNTVTFAKASDSISVELDSSIFGKTAIVALGTKPLTINAKGLARAITVATGELCLGNINLANGASAQNGGLVYNKDVLVMKDCVLTGGTVSDAGLGANLYSSGTAAAYATSFQGAKGGASVYSTGALELRACSVAGNEAQGLYVESDLTTLLSGCSVSDNGGPGVENKYGAVTLDGCTVSGNAGAGVLNSGSATVTGSTISGNAGPGVVNRSFLSNATPFSAVLNVALSKIVGNAAEKGAGIYNLAGSLSLSNCELSQNAAATDGGALYCERLQGYANTSLIVNCTVAGNTAGRYGGGVYFEPSFGTSIINSILALNYAGERDVNISGTAVPRNSLVGTSPNFIVAPVYDYAAGKLVNGDSIDLRIGADSPAINIGDNARVADGALDLAGNGRKYGKAVDAGAYEYRGSGTASVTPAYVVTTLDDSFDPSDGATSLREAVYYANDPSKTITFAAKLSGTVTLKAQLVAAADIRIDGGGRVALDAQNQSRVILAEAPLTLAGLTLVNGKSAENGGVIYAKDALTVANSTVSGGACGAAGFGGLIYAAGDFTAANSEFAQTAAGDALYLLGTSAITNSSVHNAAKDGIYSAGALTLVGTDVYANAGRGAVNDYGTVALTDSKLYENAGAGLYNIGSATLNRSAVEKNGNSGIVNWSAEAGSAIFTASVLAKDSVIRGNKAASGAGIYNRYGRVELVDCALSANVATASGGAVYTATATGGSNALILKNTTVAGNIAGKNGGGIASSSSASLLALYNAIVAQNLTGDVDSNISGEASISSGSFIGGNPGFVAAPVFDFAKKTLKNGDALDLRLASNSAALNTGLNANVDADNTTDLSGGARVYGSAVDPGAYEYRGTGEVAPAPVYTVDTLTDSFDLKDGKTSLREALYFADSDGATISFSSKLSGTIKLTSQLAATANVTVDGRGKITISGQGKTRAFLNEANVTLKDIVLTQGKTVSLGAVVYNSGTLTLRGATVSAGSASAAEPNGNVYSVGRLNVYDSQITKSANCAGLYSVGTTVASNSSFNGNASYGLYLVGTAKFTDCVIEDNAASGVYNAYGALEFKRVSLSKNAGAGLSNLGSATLTNCSVENNQNSGLVNLNVAYSNASGFSGSLRVYVSTIKGNTSSDVGGGVYNNGGFLELDNSEISANTAANYGGGVYNAFAENCLNKTNIVNCTIAGNSAGVQGGGVYNASNSFILRLYNTVAARNYSATPNANVEGFVEEAVRCILSGNPAFAVAPVFDDDGKIKNAAELDLRLTERSVALDYGDNEYIVGTVDRDGNGRVFNGTVDVGAYEFYVEGSTQVTTLDDSFDLNDDAVSLREAIYFAQDGDSITFRDGLAGTITLASSLELSANVAVIGNGAITLDGGGAVQILRTSGDVAIYDLTFANGSAAGPGGAIYNGGDLALYGCNFNGNAAANGGAVYNKSGATLTVENATFTSNSARSFGGAIQNAGALFATNALFSRNSATENGGAIYNSGNAILVGAAIVDSKSGYYGGGVYSSTGTFTLINATVARNESDRGGGFYLNSGKAVLYNDIIALNSSDYSGAASRTTALCVLSSAEFANPDKNYLYDETLPLFVNAQVGNYRLAAGSQAADLGDAALARDAGLGAYATDLANVPRYIGTSIDLGAYESVGNADIFVQENCAFELKADVGAGGKVYWDLSGTGTGAFEQTGADVWISASDRGFGPGCYYLRSKVVPKSGPAVEKTYVLRVAPVLPTLEIEAVPSVFSEVALFSVKARFHATVPEHSWRVDWGNGASTELVDDSFIASYFYETSAYDRTYTVGLTLVGADGYDEYAFQLGLVSIPGVGTPDAAPSAGALLDEALADAEFAQNALLDAAFVGPLQARQAADMFGDAPFVSAKKGPKLAALDSVLRELAEEDYAEF